MVQEAKQQAMNIRTAAAEEAKHRARQLLLEVEQGRAHLKAEWANELRGTMIKRVCESLRALLPAGAQDALDRGAGLFLSGRLDSAIAFFSGALKENPKDTRAKEILGHCLAIKGKDALREGDYAGARDSLRRAAEIFPRNDSLRTLALLAELEAQPKP